MAGILVPRLPDVTSSRLKSTARKLSGVITYTYDRAAAMGLVFRLTFDLDKNRYYLSWLNKENQFEKTELSFVKETNLPKSMTVSELVTATAGKVNKGEGFIHFFPGGYVERSVIHLTDDADNEMTLFVHPLTGRVVIKEGYVEAIKNDA